MTKTRGNSLMDVKASRLNRGVLRGDDAEKEMRGLRPRLGISWIDCCAVRCPAPPTPLLRPPARLRDWAVLGRPRGARLQGRLTPPPISRSFYSVSVAPHDLDHQGVRSARRGQWGRGDPSMHGCERGPAAREVAGGGVCGEGVASWGRGWTEGIVIRGKKT